MIIRLSKNITPSQKEAIATLLEQNGFLFRFANLYERPSFALASLPPDNFVHQLKAMAGVDEVVNFNREYILTSRAFKEESTQISVRGHRIGAKAVNIIAGPCAIESEAQIFKIAEFLHGQGVKFIRGGAYKPRTSPYRFQGLGKQGLQLIREAADAYGLQVVTEVIDTSLIDEIVPYADILQIGARNMSNFFFLKQIGKTDKPVLLKRGMTAKVDEWLMAAEYILSEGNPNVILCERGVRTFDHAFRNMLDINAIPLAKSLSHLPVFADPSHGTGRRDMVIPASLAAIAAGADGLMIEIHPDPPTALSDGDQSLYLEQFEQLLKKAVLVSHSINRNLDTELPSAITEKNHRNNLAPELDGAQHQQPITQSVCVE